MRIRQVQAIATLANDEVLDASFAEACRDYLAGKPVAAVAGLLHTTPRHFAHLRKKAGLPPRTSHGRAPRSFDPATLASLHEACAAGTLSLGAAARQLGISDPTGLRRAWARVGLAQSQVPRYGRRAALHDVALLTSLSAHCTAGQLTYAAAARELGCCSSSYLKVLFARHGVPCNAGAAPTDRLEGQRARFDAAHARYLAGDPLSAVAAAYGASPSSFSSARLALSLPARRRISPLRRPFDPTLLLSIHARCLAGTITLAAAARELHCEPTNRDRSRRLVITRS
jgi:hypothetical protein